ncbi:MAG: Gfo/Idh/MocA family oxidoreductase [Deltaproteobacteria bacterium]|nr:Gfo/Idh/MocA family oxidoreductase [Deltaproteobacteria bacterium]
MKKLRTAVVGVGKVTHLHAKALKNLKDTEFAAVYSRDISKAKMFADQYGLKPYCDIEEMIHGSSIDFVTICTPHPAHRDTVLKAIHAGSHVLVEKPLASTLEDCDAMIEAARQKDVLLGTISQRRFYEPVLRVKRAIDAGKIGRPVLGTIAMLGWRDENYYQSDPWRGTWNEEGGGVLVNQAPHQLDLLLWYMGPIDELFGYWGNLNHPYIEVDDTALAVIKFKNGGLGNIVVSNSQNPALFGQVHVHGENGASIGVQTDSGAMFIAGMSGVAEPPYNDLWTVKGEEALLDKWKKEDTDFFGKIDPTHYFHQRQFEDFAHAVSRRKRALVDGEDGRRTVELFTAIYRSNRDKKPIQFPLKPEKGIDFDGRLAG